ncbi:MAG: hypothetical protein JWL90_671 [Chthoniobacteraceae bacterium]|nr:hypothetical protein [Chthoniobacteraceae bacterium]
MEFILSVNASVLLNRNKPTANATASASKFLASALSQTQVMCRMIPPLIYRSSLMIVMALVCTALRAAALPDDPAGLAMIKEAQRAVTAYHTGHEASGAMLRVVYFHPSDREPLPGYEERLNRILNDVSEFYRDGLIRFGIASQGLPLEKKDGRLVLHVVKGKLPASGYQHESGNKTAAEIRAALAGRVDMDREHVLVLYALCRKEADGRYVFDAPYYGGGSQRGGLCHAADCELLDPALLKETGNKIVYTEHYYPRIEQTVAKFNSMYLGGTAHELGHGLGLSHDSGNPEEKSFGTSLMGSGNLTYRQEVWGGGAPVYLSRASILQLASHPLITGSDRGRWDAIGGNFTSLLYSVEKGDLKIQGQAAGNIPPYAVIAYVWPASQSTDHGARTFPVGLTDGGFTLVLNGLRPDSYHLKLAALHVNGGTTTREYNFQFDAKGAPDAAALNASWITSRAENAVMKRDANAQTLLTDDAIAAAPAGLVQRKLQLLRTVLKPVQPLDLATATEESVFLSDAAWSDAKVGWGSVARNFFWFDQNIQNGVFLTLRGQFYDKGLYAHSPSRYLFAVDQKWKRFTATIGLRDGAQAQGSAVFVVRGDGRELYRSPVLRAGEIAELELPIANVKELELLADGGEGHPHNSWAIWVNPQVAR